MVDVATKVESEKLLSLHHPFVMQINETINNSVLPTLHWTLSQCDNVQKNKVFPGSIDLQYQVALVAGKHTQQGAAK